MTTPNLVNVTAPPIQQGFAGAGMYLSADQCNGMSEPHWATLLPWQASDIRNTTQPEPSRAYAVSLKIRLEISFSRSSRVRC